MNVEQNLKKKNLNQNVSFVNASLPAHFKLRENDSRVIKNSDPFDANIKQA